jgi:hypothetical protein
MSASHRRPLEADTRDDREPPAPEAPDTAAPPLDWQVLLLRYLPQPLGSAHAIKRLTPR